MKSYCTTPKITIYFPNTFDLNFKMTSPPALPSQKISKILPLPQKKNKYATKANKKIEYFELNKWFAPPCAFYISRYPLCQGRGACDPVGFISHAQYPDPKLF